LTRKYRKPFHYPWDVPAPTALQVDVDDAKRFSALARGATLQYYHYLIEARRAKEWPVPKADVSGSFQAWWGEGRKLLTEWDIHGFLQRHARDMRTLRGDATFLQNWWRACCNASNALAFLGDERAHRLIVDREKACKPTKARLTYPKHLWTWNRELPGTEVAFQLNYRANIGGLFVRRILEGLHKHPTRGQNA
jgi:hypothetical protein